MFGWLLLESCWGITLYFIWSLETYHVMFYRQYTVYLYAFTLVYYFFYTHLIIIEKRKILWKSGCVRLFALSLLSLVCFLWDYSNKSGDTLQPLPRFILAVTAVDCDEWTLELADWTACWLECQLKHNCYTFNLTLNPLKQIVGKIHGWSCSKCQKETESSQN